MYTKHLLFIVCWCKIIFVFDLQGFNPREISDPLYYRKGSKYEPLTPEIYDEILGGKIRM